MENSYGIGITNRYDLFCMDDGDNDMESILSKKAKQQKKAAAAAAKAATASVNEKENKVATATVIKPPQSAAPVKGTQQQNGQPPKSTRPIKETQNIRSNSDKGPPREEKSKDGVKTFDRNTAPNNKPNGETREQRYNRRNRDDTNRTQSTQQYNGNATNNQSGNNNNLSEQTSNHRNDDRPPRRVGNYTGGNDRRGGGGGDGQRRTFEGRGKREFDRQSGSEKTGVKAIDKREGGGAHNWGTHKQDIEDLNKTNSEFDPEKDTKEEGTAADGTANKDETEAQQSPAEEETKEITLDEWKAQRAGRAKPQFNIRKAGEGEDTSQWKKMIALQSRKKKDDDNSDEELEYDPSMYPQRVGRQKHVLDIEFHFNDGRRGGLNRGGRGGRPRGVGGPNNAGGERGERRGPNRNRNERNNDRNERNDRTDRNDRNDRSDRNDNNEGNERSEGDRPPRPPRGERRGPYGGEDRRAGGGGHGQNAPKVDDEHDFPSLN